MKNFKLLSILVTCLQALNCNTSEAMNNMNWFNNNMNQFNNANLFNFNNINQFNNNMNWFQHNNFNQFNNMNWFNNNLNGLNNNILHFNNQLNNNFNNKNIVTQSDVVTFLQNIKNSQLSKENLIMQLYSLLGNRNNIPVQDNTHPDKIQFLMDFIMDHANNNFNNYNQINNNSVKIVYVLLDYYLKNIELYRYNNNLFNYNSINYLNNSLPYSIYDFQNALRIIMKYNFHNILDKLIKGINLVENTKRNNIVNVNNNHNNNKPILLSNGESKCFLVSALQQFIGALKQSSENDYIRNTTFAKFVRYMKVKQNDNNRKIDFIQTLRKFVVQNKQWFNTEKQKEALNALFAQEEESHGGAAGLLGTIFILRIFPELQPIFSGDNKFGGSNDSLLMHTNYFKFDTKKHLKDQFDDQSAALLCSNPKCRKPFNSNSYIIRSIHGTSIDKLVRNKQYISLYNDQGNLEIYELIGMQLRRPGHYISYVKQNNNSNSWSLINSMESGSNNNHTIAEIFALLDNANNYVVHQAMYKRIQ